MSNFWNRLLNRKATVEPTDSVVTVPKGSPLCKDCKHYQARGWVSAGCLDKCLRETATDLVTGKKIIVDHYCDLERNSKYSGCGTDGKYFEQSNQNITLQNPVPVVVNFAIPDPVVDPLEELSNKIWTVNTNISFRDKQIQEYLTTTSIIDKNKSLLPIDEITKNRLVPHPKISKAATMMLTTDMFIEQNEIDVDGQPITSWVCSDCANNITMKIYKDC